MEPRVTKQDKLADGFQVCRVRHPFALNEVLPGLEERATQRLTLEQVDPEKLGQQVGGTERSRRAVGDVGTADESNGTVLKVAEANWLAASGKDVIIKLRTVAAFGSRDGVGLYIACQLRALH